MLFRKSIFIGLSDDSILRSGLWRKSVGDVLYITARFCGDPPRPIEGKVLAIYNEPGGRTLLVQNMRKGDMRYLCSGWEFIPIWIGSQCGVVALWNDLILRDRITVEKTILEYRVMCENRRRENELIRALAL